MFIKITKQPQTFQERIIETNSKKIYLDARLEKTEYVIENDRFIFLIDTNITKDREANLRQALNTLSVEKTGEINTVLKENYFVTIIDKTTLEVHLMRDICGVKTGYFSSNENELIIGSVMHEVAKKSGQNSFDSVGVEQLICSGYLLDGQTLYQGVEEINTGTHITFNSNLHAVELQRDYVQFAEKDNDFSAKENFKMLREEFKIAHEKYVSKNNKILLSGGLDSIAMAIALDDLKAKNTDAVSFRVKDTTQDETVYAKDIAEHLDLPLSITEIDAEVPQNMPQFDEMILKMNNPYFGAWIFGNFKANERTMLYAGQDTRLHTPALNEVDKWAFSLLNHQNKFWLKNLAKPLAAFAKSVFEKWNWDKSSSSILKNLHKATHIFDLESYLKKFYLKLGKEQLENRGLPVEHYAHYEAHFDLDLSKISSQRMLYNKLVELKWGEQYLYDMRYLQDLARINGTYIAMPFYNQRLAKFSSGIPFKLATKALFGRARFGKKRSIIYKYVLRHALKDKLTDMSFYRAKAVSQTLHQLFNGAVGAKIKTGILNDLKREDSFVKKFKLEAFVEQFLNAKSFQMNDADYLAKIYYIGTLAIYHKEIVTSEKVEKPELAIA